MSTDLVFFLHRLGFKIYKVSPSFVPTELIDVPTLDPAELKSKLESFSGQTFCLLISDTISYLFHTQIPTTNVPISRELVSAKIKNDIPQNVESTKWDYKIINTLNGQADILVFALVSEFQDLINDLSTSLKITFEVTEPESIASSRHPDPIVGILKKDDFNAKDDQSLNLAFVPETNSSPFNPLPFLALLIIVILFVGGSYYFLRWYRQNKALKPTIISTAIPTIISTPSPNSPTPTVYIVKPLADLTLMVQNGTGKTGYASQIATQFTTAGFKNISTGNAATSKQTTSQLIFKDDTLKNAYESKFIAVFSVPSANISVDKTINYDALLILGTH